VTNVNTLDHLRIGSVGQIAPGTELKIESDGEILARGPQVMKGYYKRPEATAQVIDAEGWFATGDIGVIDADGYLAIVDRKKDMIIRGGFNVYPREVEEVLLTHPSIAQCAVIGVPDDRLGEDVKAVIVRRPGETADEEAIVAWCRERMAAYKAPRYVEIREALPMGATGKVLKRALRAS